MRETVKLVPRKILSLLMCVLMLISALPIASVNAYAEPGDTVIDELTITVTDNSDNAIKGANVVLDDSAKTTDKNGEVTFNNVTVENKVVNISADGYANKSVTLVLDASTTTAQVKMEHLYTVTGKVKSNVDDYLTNYTVTATDGGNDVEVTKSGSTFSYVATEGNDTTYTVTAKNHASTVGTINAISQDIDLNDVILNANKQTVKVKLTDKGTAKINGSSVNNGNSVDIDFTNDEYEFKAEADKDNGYHIEKITGAVSFAHAQNASNGVKNEKTVHEETVTLDKSKTEDEINVVFALNKYDVSINENKNYVFTVTVDDTTYVYDNQDKIYTATFAHGQDISISVSEKGKNNIDTVTIDGTMYSESSTPKKLYEFYDQTAEKYKFDVTVKRSFSISATTVSADMEPPVDSSAISVDIPVFKEDSKYYYKNSVKIKNTNPPKYATKNISYNDGNNDEHEGIGSVTISRSTDIAKIYVRQSGSLHWHPVSYPTFSIIIDTESPTVTAEAKPSDWTNNDKVTVSGNVKDDGGSGIDYIVYSKSQLNSLDAIKAALLPTVDEQGATVQAVATKIDDADISSDKKTAKFSFDVTDEQDQTYYIYAVDRVGNVSEEKPVDVKIDRTKPFVTNIDYYLGDQKIVFNENDKLSDTLYGRSSDKDFEVEVEVRDIFVNGASAGPKEVVLYAEDEDGVRKLSVSPTSTTSTTPTTSDDSEDGNKFNKTVYRFRITSENAQKWTQVKAEAIDGAGNKSEITDKKDATLNGIKFAILISKVKPEIAISESSVSDYSEKTTSDKYSVINDEVRYNNWYSNRTVSFKVNIGDNCPDGAHTGLKSVKISINNRTINNTVYSKSDKTKDTFNISTQDTIIDETDSDNGKTLVDASALNEGINTVKVEAVNNNGQKTEKEYYFYRDVTHPNFVLATYSKADQSVAQQIIEWLTFGVFSNDDIALTLEAVDKSESVSDQSKLAKIEIYNNNTLIETKEFDADSRKNRDDKTFTIELNDGYIGYICAKVTDSVGNESFVDPDAVIKTEGTIKLEKIPSNYKIASNYLVLENTPPTITSSSLDNPTNRDEQSKDNDKNVYVVNSATNKKDEAWYGSDVDVELTFNDSGISSGLYESGLKINNSYIQQNAESEETAKNSHRIYYEYATDDDEKYEGIVNSNTLTVNSKNATANEDGSYVATGHIRDNAGNVGSEYSKTFYIDRDAPDVTKFEFDKELYQEPIDGNSAAEKDNAEVKNYGYYFNEATNVTITADDSKGPTSGISYITVRFINYDGNITYSDVSLNVDKNNQATFKVPENFKGQIIACATDNVGHEGNYITPDGVIYETNEPAIKFNDPTFAKNGVKTSTKSTVQAAYRLHEIPENFTDVQKENAAKNTYYKNELFNGDAYLPFEIDDSAVGDSGVRKIEWEITAVSASDVLASGYCVIDNDNNKEFGEQVNNGNNSKLANISIDESKNENNLVHRITGDFLIGDNYNDIIVKITVTDRSGNTETKSKAISIDKTAPKIELSFTDKDKNTGKFADYYNTDREAVITITERNFDPALIDYVISNIDKDYTSTPDIEKSIRKLNNWSNSWSKNATNSKHGYVVSNPDSSEYVYKFKFKANGGSGNGTYDLKFSLKDTVGNESKAVNDRFVIDATPPSITVTYSDNGESKKNAGYFNEDRTITVTIVEHNINESIFKQLFTNLIEQSNNGDKNKKVTQPQFTSFKKIGKDMYSATAVCKDNAKYSINMSLEDMAGNIFILAKEKKDAYQFDVDHDMPEFEIKGIDDVHFASYNKDTIIPVIKITDKDGNLDTVVDLEKSFTISIKGTKHKTVKYDYNSISDDISIKKVENGYEFTLKFVDPKKFEYDDIYMIDIEASDLAGNTRKLTRFVSINRYGSTYDYNLLKNRFDEGSFFEDVLYITPFVNSKNPLTIFTEVNCDNIKIGDTKLKLVYSNTKQQTEKEIELERGKHYIVEPSADNKKEFHTKMYEYKLIDDALFNEDGVYEIFATTKDEAKNTNNNTIAVDEAVQTKRIIKFVVDNTAPRMDVRSTFEKIDYINDDVYKVNTSNQKSQIRDDLFSKDGKSCTFKLTIDEENLGLDAIDISKLKVKFNNSEVAVDENSIVDENGVYDISFTLNAPDNLTKTGDLVVSISDRAGQERTLTAEGLQISNNWFIRFINNKLALGITIGVILFIAVGISIFFIVKRRKERDDEE